VDFGISNSFHHLPAFASTDQVSTAENRFTQTPIDPKPVLTFAAAQFRNTPPFADPANHGPITELGRLFEFR